MKRNIQLNKENEKNKKQKIKEENETDTKQKSLLDIFDKNILSQIFIELTVPIISEEQEKKEDYKCCFLNCVSFSLTSKIFNLIPKQIKFTITIFKQEKIENINFNIYLKLNYILLQEEIKNKIFNTKEKLLNAILIYTSKKGIYDTIPTLILNGANIDYKHRYERTPLSYSCENGYYNLSKLLISYNANINVNDGNDSLLHLSCRSGNLKLVKYLIEEKELEINEKNVDEETPLFNACYSGNLNLVKYLIEEKELEINIIAKWNNRTILFDSMMSTNVELIDYLLSLGLEIDYKDTDGYTVLYHCCIFIRNFETMKHLILRGKVYFKIQKIGTESKPLII